MKRKDGEMTYFIAIWFVICPICHQEVTGQTEGNTLSIPAKSTNAPYEQATQLIECPYCHIALFARLKLYKQIDDEYDTEKYEEWEREHPNEECPFVFTKPVETILYEKKN